MMPPGRRRPRSSASWMMASAARSFTEPPGFRNSALPRILQPVASDAPASSMSGVSPMLPMNPLRISMAARLSGGGTAVKPAGLAPGGADPIAVERKPLERDDAGGIGDRPFVEPAHRIGEGQDLHPDVLMLFGQAVNAAGPAAVHP